jgi:hypothetical protein
MQCQDFVNTMMDPSFYNCQSFNTRMCSYIINNFTYSLLFLSTIPTETFVVVSFRIIIFFRVSNGEEKQYFSRFVSPGVI